VRITNSERLFGTFTRSVKVVPGLRPKDIKASTDSGILRIEVPKIAPKQQITIT
jgi:HSP20 family molecular chaperone IbpA